MLILIVIFCVGGVFGFWLYALLTDNKKQQQMSYGKETLKMEGKKE